MINDLFDTPPLNTALGLYMQTGRTGSLEITVKVKQSDCSHFGV